MFKYFKKIKFPLNNYIVRVDEKILLILIATVVGSVSGFAAVVLNKALDFFANLWEMNHLNWYLFIIPGLGAMIGSFFILRVTKEGSGHGVPEVIYAATQDGYLKFRSIFSKLIACVFTIASGGSAGPEGPIVVSGASIGSNIATWLRLKDKQRKVLLACGSAGAIASIFNAPVAGMIFSLEVILGEWATINIIPIAVASVMGTEVSRIFQGNQIPFHNAISSISFADFISVIGLAFCTALTSISFAKILRIIFSFFQGIKIKPEFKAFTGGIIVGLIGIVFPQVLGDGYEIIKSILHQQFSPAIIIMFILIFLKITATSFTISSGASGGLFAPSLVIGAFTGLFYYKIIQLIFPHIVFSSTGLFPLLGMAGVLSSMMHAPLTGIFLITEITGSYKVLGSLVLVSAISTTFSHFFEPVSFYHKELLEKNKLLKPKTDKKILSELNILELLETDCARVTPDMKLKNIIPVIINSHRNYFVVEDKVSKKYLGLLNLDDIKPYIFNPLLSDSILIEEVMNKNIPIVPVQANLYEIFDLFDETSIWSLPVVDGDKFLGLISKATILDHYRKELMIEEDY